MRLTKRKWAVALVATTAAALALAGCTSTASTKTSGPALTNQTLRLSIQSPPSNLSIGNYSGGQAYLFLSTYDTLVTRNAANKIEPEAAKSWSYSKDLKTLTFKLRSGMTFSDGEKVNASAVAASFAVDLKGSSTSQNLAKVSSVKAVGASTVVFNLSQPDAALLPNLTGAVGAFGAPKYLTAKSSQLTPVGSGPYTLDSAKTTVGSVYTLDRNPKFWNENAFPFKTVTFSVIADPTAVQNAVQSGQLDWAGLTAKSAESQFPSPQYTTGNLLTQAFGGLFLVDRTGKVVPALASLKVRQAINYALDRKGIANALTPGEGSATDQMFDPEGAAYSAALNKVYPYDVAKAKQLMSEAGYANGFSVTMPSTVVSTQYESSISQELGAIGIKVTWVTVPFQEFYAKAFGGSYGMFFMFNGPSGSDAVDLNAATSGVFNPFNLTTPEYQKLSAAANNLPEGKAQDAALRAVNKYLVDQAWYAPIVAVQGAWVASNKVKFTPSNQVNETVIPWAPASSK